MQHSTLSRWKQKRESSSRVTCEVDACGPVYARLALTCLLLKARTNTAPSSLLGSRPEALKLLLCFALPWEGGLHESRAKANESHTLTGKREGCLRYTYGPVKELNAFPGRVA